MSTTTAQAEVKAGQEFKKKRLERETQLEDSEETKCTAH